MSDYPKAMRKPSASKGGLQHRARNAEEEAALRKQGYVSVEAEPPAPEPPPEPAPPVPEKPLVKGKSRLGSLLGRP